MVVRSKSKNTLEPKKKRGGKKGGGGDVKLNLYDLQWYKETDNSGKKTYTVVPKPDSTTLAKGFQDALDAVEPGFYSIKSNVDTTNITVYIDNTSKTKYMYVSNDRIYTIQDGNIVIKQLYANLPSIIQVIFDNVSIDDSEVDKIIYNNDIIKNNNKVTGFYKYNDNVVYYVNSHVYQSNNTVYKYNKYTGKIELVDITTQPPIIDKFNNIPKGINHIQTITPINNFDDSARINSTQIAYPTVPEITDKPPSAPPLEENAGPLTPPEVPLVNQIVVKAVKAKSEKDKKPMENAEEEKEKSPQQNGENAAKTPPTVNTGEEQNVNSAKSKKGTKKNNIPDEVETKPRMTVFQVPIGKYKREAIDKQYKQMFTIDKYDYVLGYADFAPSFGILNRTVSNVDKVDINAFWKSLLKWPSVGYYKDGIPDTTKPKPKYDPMLRFILKDDSEQATEKEGQAPTQVQGQQNLQQGQNQMLQRTQQGFAPYGQQQTPMGQGMYGNTGYGQGNGQGAYAPGTSGPPIASLDKGTDLKFAADARSISKRFARADDQEREKQVQTFLELFATFTMYMEKKQAKWGADVESMTQYLKGQLSETANTIKGYGDDRPAKREKDEDKYLYNIKRMVRTYTSKSNTNFAAMKDFFVKRGRKGVRTTLRYLKEMAYVGDPNFLSRPEFLKDLDAKSAAEKTASTYNEILKKYNEIAGRLRSSNDNLYNKLDQILEIANGKYANLAEEKQKDVEDSVDNAYMTIRKQLDKINSFYELKYSLLEMIMDSQFFVIYFLKAIRILFSYVALFLSTRMFVPIYEDTVYSDKKDPPPLWKFMLIYLGFDLSLNVFLIVLLYLLKYLFKTDDNSFFIDSYMIANNIGDYIFTIIVIMLVGVLISRIIVQKKYFKYKYEGMRAIRAFEKIMFSVAIVNTLVPYFLIF